MNIDDLAPIFVDMYRGRYPSPDLLTELNSEADYVSEPVSILDNIIFVFQYLPIDAQIEFLIRLKPFTAQLTQSRFCFTKRLVALVSAQLGSYNFDNIENVVLPMATEALYF